MRLLTNGGESSRSFVLEPSPDEIRICTQCGRQVITCRRTAKGKVVKEFVDSEGRCSQCAHPE
jgi:hypothetical protein